MNSRHESCNANMGRGKALDPAPGPAAFFPKSRFYAGLVNSKKSMLRESRDTSFSAPCSERHLQCVWFDSAFRPGKLKSVSGDDVFVEDPGRWNLEAGPDFLDATLIIGPDCRKVRGDIEIHIHPGDWAYHHHTGDNAYARLIAHVCYFQGQVPEETLPAGTIQISLRDSLNADPAFSFESIDTTAYPYAAASSKVTPCAEILASWPPDSRAMLLESAGEERLKAKAFRMETPIREKGADQVLYEEIMAAFGYKQNSIAFRQLAARVPINTIREECRGDILKAYALLAGVSGLLPSKVSPKWKPETRSFIRQLWDFWWKNQTKWETRLMKQSAWKLSGLRPQNSPLRRMAAAASLFAADDSISTRLTRINTNDAKSWRRNIALLFNASEAVSYWSRQLSFSGVTQKSDIALIGADRIAAIESNVFLPFLATRGIPVRRLVSQIPPEHDNNVIRLTAYALFGRDHNPALYHHGLRQQGLIQIFHDFCLNNRSACKDCPLTQALKSADFPVNTPLA